MADTRQQSLIEMNRQLEEKRNQQIQRTEAQELRSRAQELGYQEMQESISRLMEMMQTLVTQQRPVTDPSSSTNGNPTLPQHPPRPPDPVVAGTGGSTATEQPLAHRAPLNPHGLTTRLARFEFPKFDGTLLGEWIYRCEQFFMLDSTPPESKVRLASLHMEGKVLQWHHTYMSTRYDQFPLWPEYIVAMTTHFGGELFDDPLAEPVSSKQNAESVEDEVQTEEQYSTEACDANLHKGGLKCDELIPQGVEPSQILEENEPNSAKESSVLIAHQVFDKMPQPTKTIEVDLIDELTKDVDVDDSLETASCIQEDFEPPIVVDEPIVIDELPHQAALQMLDKMPRSFVSGELIFLNEIEKINEELVDGLNWKSPPMSSVKELDGGKVTGDGELRNTTPTTHALKLPTEFSEKESMMNGVVCVICFDPGGSILPVDTSNITSSFDPGGSQQDYVPPPLPKHPAGFMVDDHERALMASSKRIVTVVDPTNNLPMECTIRRIFTSSKGAECMLLCLVDMPVEIVKSASDGWAAVTDEELDATLPTADYALARIYMHLVHSGFYFTARGGFCYLEDSIMEFVAEGETMERMPCEPTTVMWGALLAGCRDYKLSEFVAWKLVEMEPENSAHYVVLSKLYAEMGRWADVSKDRGLMEERELMKAFEIKINDLKYAPLLLVINEFSDFVKCPSELPAQNVRMVAYIGVLCFDPAGEEMLSAFDDFDRCCTGIKLSNGAAELLAYDYDFARVEVNGLNYKMSFGLTHLIQELISIRVVTVAAAHDHHEGNVLILVFDPGGKHVQLTSLVAMLVFESYILEDKDLLNKGDLLQDYEHWTRFVPVKYFNS